MTPTSPTPLEFLADLRRQGVRVWAEADKLNYTALPGALTPELRAELSRRKPELLTVLRPASVNSVPITPAPRDQPLPLSYQQERLWFLDQLAPGNPAFNVPNPIRLDGPLDIGALERSLSVLVERHESLRVTFELRDGRPVQVVHPAAPVRLPVDDLSALPAPDRLAQARAQTEALAHIRFDLAAAPGWTARLLRLGPAEHILLLTVHHILTDAWSANVLFAELAALYEAYASGQTLALPPLPIQYADYAAWQRQTFTAEGLNEGLTYWRQRLADAPPASGLRPDFPRPPVQTWVGRTLTADLAPTLVNALQALSQPENATLFMTLLAALKVVLYAHTGQADLVVGAPAAARARPQVEKIVGMFVNNLALRTDLSGDPTFRALLKRVRATALAAYAQQHVPFEKLLEDLRPERMAGRTPIFQVFFNMLTQERPVLMLPGLVSTRPTAAAAAPALFDLSFMLRRQADTWTVAMTYNTDLFEHERLAGLFAQYLALLPRLVAAPDQPLSAFSLLTAAQRQWVLHDLNATAAPLPPAPTVTALIEAQARLRPAHTAVMAGAQTLSYGELDRQSNQLAHYLRGLGAGRDRVVALCLDRTPEMIVALLAIHKAGGAYLPLDPDYPAERLAFLLADSDAPLLVTTAARADLFAQAPARLVVLDRAEVATMPLTPPAIEVTGDDLAYFIYTSGTTGRPKGVLVEHRSLLNHTAMAGRVYGLGPADRVLQFAALSWDTSVEEIFPALAFGATLVLRTPDMLDTLQSFVEGCHAAGVTVLHLPAAFWHALAAPSPQHALQLRLAETVRLVNTGGERVQRQRVAQWQAALGTRVRLFDSYGASEATAVTTLAELTHLDASTAEVPIGRPVDNVQVYVLNEQRQPALPGTPGELYIGGLGVARGYHNRPELTAARFIPHPFDPTPGARLYRTGDLAVLRADGQLEYRGRGDRQVKVRGYRIEPGEIEAVLREHPAVRDAVLVETAAGAGDNALVAYLAPRAKGGERDPAEMRAWLQARLPAFMLPAAFVNVPALPLSPNGKLDLAALPPAPLAGADAAALGRPRDELEQQLAALWQDVLGKPSVGIHDDFFALGGHSLLAIRLFSRIESVFGRRLPLALLFDSPTVAHLARVLAQGRNAPPGAPLVDWPVLVPIQPLGDRPPFFCVHDVGGTIVRFAELGRLIGQDQPFYALEAQGLRWADRAARDHRGHGDLLPGGRAPGAAARPLSPGRLLLWRRGGLRDGPPAPRSGGSRGAGGRHRRLRAHTPPALGAVVDPAAPGPVCRQSARLA